MSDEEKQETIRQAFIKDFGECGQVLSEEGWRVSLSIWETAWQAAEAANAGRELALAEALMGMVEQYCQDKDGSLRHYFMSANEQAFDVLENLGLLRETHLPERYEFVKDG